MDEQTLSNKRGESQAIHAETRAREMLATEATPAMVVENHGLGDLQNSAYMPTAAKTAGMAPTEDDPLPLAEGSEDETAWETTPNDSADTVT